MKNIYKDILTVENGLILHQVNAKGVMGAGLALQIRRKWPVVYEMYRDNTPILGQAQFVPVSDTLDVVNVCAQQGYGRGECHTHYKALACALGTVAIVADAIDRLVHIPYKMGCGLAGGDWPTVLEIIHETVPDAVICRR